jgi:hypothetical protein
MFNPPNLTNYTVLGLPLQSIMFGRTREARVELPTSVADLPGNLRR